MKYILVTSGSFSGIGKGILSASIGAMLQSYGYNVTFLKMEPYLNYSAGRLEPSEHGETCVLVDGAEVDLDLGYYQKFCSLILDGTNSLTSGRILSDIIENEKSGAYNGKTLRFCSDFNGYIAKRLKTLEEKPVRTFAKRDTYTTADIVIIELGGTLGDDEVLFPLKGLSRFLSGVAQTDKCVITLDYAIDMGDVTKTKLLQNSLNNLKSFGVLSDILIYRGVRAMEEAQLEKVANNCGIEKGNIVWSKECGSQYEIPQALFEQGLYSSVKNVLCLDDRDQAFDLRQRFSLFIKPCTKSKKVGIISRYLTNDLPYNSLEDALVCAGKHCGCEIEPIMINYVKLAQEEPETFQLLREVDGIIIPGGFGDLNVETKVMVAQYARANNIPLLGICLGFQIMAIEYAKNVLGIRNASSEEFGTENAEYVVRKHPEIICKNTGADIFLGMYPVKYDSTFGTRIYKAEECDQIFRHRYSLNPQYENALDSAGLKIVGRTEDNKAVAISVEGNKFYCGVQYHPELSGRPESVDAIIMAFVEAVADGQ